MFSGQRLNAICRQQIAVILPQINQTKINVIVIPPESLRPCVVEVFDWRSVASIRGERVIKSACNQSHVGSTDCSVHLFQIMTSGRKIPLASNLKNGTRITEWLLRHPCAASSDVFVSTGDSYDVS